MLAAGKSDSCVRNDPTPMFRYCHALGSSCFVTAFASCTCGWSGLRYRICVRNCSIRWSFSTHSWFTQACTVWRNTGSFS